MQRLWKNEKLLNNMAKGMKTKTVNVFFFFLSCKSNEKYFNFDCLVCEKKSREKNCLTLHRRK